MSTLDDAKEYDMEFGKRKKASVLEQYKEGILYLIKQGHTIKSVKQFLEKKYGVVVTIQNISIYLARCKKREKRNSANFDDSVSAPVTKNAATKSVTTPVVKTTQKTAPVAAKNATPTKIEAVDDDIDISKQMWLKSNALVLHNKIGYADLVAFLREKARVMCEELDLEFSLNQVVDGIQKDIYAFRLEDGELKFWKNERNREKYYF